MKYFLDTEFDGFGGPLISLALVREDGAYFYCVVRNEASDPWVRENVLPILEPFPDKRYGLMDRATAARMLADFLRDDGNPTVITDWPDDIRYFCELIITGPGQMVAIPHLRFEMRRVDAYPTTLQGAIQHNAWWDAMALRHMLLVGA